MTITALARDQGVSPASASAMVKKLAALELLEHEPYRGARLTRRGRAGRLEVIRHHRLLELYLAADARPRRRRGPRRGRPARARDLGGARGADRPRARLPDPRSARRPDPGRRPQLAAAESARRIAAPGVAENWPKKRRSSGSSSSSRRNGFTLPSRPSLSETTTSSSSVAVRRLQRVVELVADEDVVLLVRLGRGAELLVHRPADRPDRTGAPLDPDHDPLLAPGVVPSIQDALDVDPSRVSGLHPVEYTNRAPATCVESVAVARVLTRFKGMFSFLFTRTKAEEVVAEYVIREHHRGRTLDDILEDPYVTNRLKPEQSGGCSTGRTSSTPSATTSSPRTPPPRRRQSSRPTPRSRASSTTRAPAARSQAAIAVRLEDDDVGVGRPALDLAGDDLLELVHLEPVEHAALDRLDQVSRLVLRLLAASRSRRTPRARAPRCRARAATDRSRRRRRRAPLRCSHSPRSTGSFDVVTVTTTSCSPASRCDSAGSRRAPRRTPRGARGCGSTRRRARSPARAARMHAICDAACQPQPITPSVAASGLREVARGDARRGAGPELPELVGLDHRLQPLVLEREQQRRRTAWPSRIHA